MRDEEVETLTVSTLETVSVNSTLEKSHCMHLRLGKTIWNGWQSEGDRGPKQQL